jgi:glutamine---fructose-6-phosphate transaminase (isomerizing)
MCGIIAVLRRPARWVAPPAGPILDGLDEVAAELAWAAGHLGRGDVGSATLARLATAGARLDGIDAELRGTAGVACLLSGPGPAVADAVSQRAVQLEGKMRDLEGRLDTGEVLWAPSELEAVNAALVGLKDASWAIGRDRVGAALAIADLMSGGWPADLVAAVDGAAVGGPPDRPGDSPTGSQPGDGTAAMDAFWAIQTALSSIDRLEVRGRDSAGLHVLVAGHAVDLAAPDVRALLGARVGDPLFTSMAVRTPLGHLSFVYKAAAEIGELGDNTRALRAAIRSDPLLHLAVSHPDARCTVLGHTRWASVGVISEANAHPLNSEEVGRRPGPYVVAAVNGDVDNHLDLGALERLAIPAEVTTDSKVVPTLVSRRLAEGLAMDEAFRTTVASFDGSVAIAASTAGDPDRLYLALRGSGQALYVGLADDAFIVASEPYGLVEETACYLRLDGETTHGQVVVLDRSGAGTLEGLARFDYHGNPLPPAPDEVRTAEITTRDIDRAGFPHFLLKEISEAPGSFRKTLRGKIVAEPRTGRLSVRLGDETLPPDLRNRLASGAITRILVIGQGTAAVAGQSIAAAIDDCLNRPDQAAGDSRRSPVTVAAVLATELSGFSLADDMADTLVIAVSQSGTTTDTNRTVDLVRARGGHVIAVVNRRNSDLVDKSDGVLYTSDGRDVEMSVASTKAFYAQVAAGFLLAVALGDNLGCGDAHRGHRLLGALRDLPDAMQRVLGQREEIAWAASRLAPSRRYWAVVGNGPNRIAASEIRIKLSELCYKSIACDATEDKKHIDLSSEPLILVCAAGLSGPNAGDVAKEIAIYRAHKAAPIVIASHGDTARFSAAFHTIEVPAVDPALAFVLSAMAGHLFSYEAALSIDAQARPLREARAAVEAAVSGAWGGRAADAKIDGDRLLAELRPALTTAAVPFFEGVRAGAYNGHLEAATAVRVTSLLRYTSGLLPVEGYELEYGKVGTPGAMIGDLVEALTGGIEELTRPIDAIKHQAKTVTVGISRSEDALLKVGLVTEALAAGASQDCLSYRALRTLAELDPSVASVLGFTRYRIEGGIDEGATIRVVDQGGLARQLTSRTERDPRLRGTKHRAAEEREVTVAKGRSDGRTVIFVPETKDAQVTGMTLLHVEFQPRLAPQLARQVLSGYRNRYAALADAVTETEPVFDDEVLGDVSVVDLLTEPVYILADRWRHPAP